MPRYLFIANPTSGKGRRLSDMKAAETWSKEKLPGSVWKWTEGPRHATALAAAALEQKADSIAVFGGDGTFNEVVNGLAKISQNKRPGLALFSSGTGGDFYRTLAEHFPVTKDLNWLKKPREIAIDFGKAQVWDKAGDRKEHYFLNAGDCGISGEVVRRVSLSGKFLGSLEYLRSTLSAAVHFELPLVRINGFTGQNGGPPKECRIMTVVAANGRYFGGGMCIAPDARIDDRLLEWVVIEKVSYLSLLKELRHFYFKRRISHPKVHYGRGQAIEIEVIEGTLPIDLDGEYWEGVKVRFEVVPLGLKLLLPNG